MVSDPFGETEHEIISTLSGIIVLRAVMPVVNEGDAEEVVDTLSIQLGDKPLFDEDGITQHPQGGNT